MNRFLLIACLLVPMAAVAQKPDLSRNTTGMLPGNRVVSAPITGSKCLHNSADGLQITEAGQDCPLPNGVLTVSTTSGVDLGTQANALWAQCGYNCVVYVPSGVYPFNTTPQMTKPGQSLIGAGSGQVFLLYGGSGDGLFWQMNPFSIKTAGTLKGFSIICTSAAANCIHSGSVEGSKWDDITVSGATGVGASGILMENALIGGVQGYTEQTSMRNVRIGYSAQVGFIPGNKNGLVFRVNGGTNSFGYGDYHVWLNVEAGQTGVLIDTGALVYHNVLNFQGNLDQATASALTVKGTSNQSKGVLLMESVNGDHTNAIHVTSTGVFNNPGMSVMLGSGDVIGTGGNIPVTKDAGGFYVVDTVGAYPGITDIQGEPQLPLVETGYQAISADGAIVVAQAQGTAARAGDMSGRLILMWPNNTNRSHTMIIDVACSQFETTSCSMNIPVNNDYAGQAVFSNPVIKLDGGSPSVPQIQVTIGNRNGVSQNVVAAWYGAPASVTNNAAPILFPGTALGSGAVVVTGITSDTSGVYSLNGIALKPVITASLTTSAATTNTVTVTGMTASGFCTLEPTNSAAAAGIASVFVSAKTTNQITVTHTATSGWTFDVSCTPN